MPQTIFTDGTSAFPPSRLAAWGTADRPARPGARPEYRSPGSRPAMTIEPPSGRSERHRDDRRPAPRVSLRDVSVTFGEHRVVRDVTLDLRRNKVTALVGPSGCGKTTILRAVNRLHDDTGGKVAGQRARRRSRRLRPRHAARAGAQPGGHGLPAPEPVPHHEHLRQRRGRPAPQRRALEVDPQGGGRGGAAPRCAVGPGEGPPPLPRRPTVRWAAAAPVHRPRPGGGARGAAHGRALLVARPDRHRQDRGAHRPSRHRRDDRARHPQHVPGHPGVGLHRLLPARGRPKPPASSSSTARRRRSSTRRNDPRTKAYVSGEVG